MLGFRFVHVLFALGAGLLPAGRAAAAPILEYRFDGTGTSAASTGTNTTPLLFLNAAGVAADLHGAPGSGVTGGLGLATSATDRAFDNSAATAMGNIGTGGLATHAADLDAIDGFTSFTLSGWFRTAGTAPYNGFARLFVNRNATNGFHLLAGDVGGEMRPAVDANEAADVAGWADTQTWVFFAMTYNGTLTSNNVNLYKGYRNSAEAGGSPNVSLVSTITINSGPVGNDTAVLQVGNRTARDRPFDGFLDNFRIHGTQTANDASGALTLAQLEAIRFADMNPIPEASPAWLLTLAAAAALMVHPFRRAAAPTRR
mgnify:CR=1 FL=1